MKTSDYTEFTVSGTPGAFVLVCEGKERVMNTSQAIVLAAKMRHRLRHYPGDEILFFRREDLTGEDSEEEIAIKRDSVLKAGYFLKNAIGFSY